MTFNAAPLPPAQFEKLNIPGWSYAGFWARFWALCFDMFLMTVMIIVLSVILPIALLAGQILTWPMAGLFAGMQMQLVTSGLPFVLVSWVYFAGMECSLWQATLGKKMMGLRVVRMDGARVNFGRASVRYFAKYISAAIWLLGFVMAAFTLRKQALHDILAETLVIQRVALVEIKEN